MTDTSSLAITHATTDSYPVPAPLGSPTANGAVSDSIAPDEEEPYTIKCICSFDEDDGSTVFCEGCETWQHIICYYPDKRVPDVHNCVDCEPRPLDSRRAADRQRQRRIREQSEDGDRKKRSGAKSQKKKGKDGDMNGLGHQRSESGARDQPPVKKTKTSHRSSASIGAFPGAPNLPPDSRKRRSSASVTTSPTKFPGPLIPLYSNEFLNLYDRDENYVDMDSNLFVNVSLVGDTASWLKDPDALARVTNGRRAEETFIRSDVALDRSSWPTLTIETIIDSNIEIGGRHPTWKILKTQDAVRKDEIVGEITGKVGIFDDYCLDPNNRWAELRHPEPFVFFSSHLPLYIDSRHEGSALRYTRRSCRPNVTMKIFITNDVEYHFCFVAKEDIPANAEITIMWYLDAQLSESSNGIVKQESGDSATETAASCISNTLANFGGCACEHPENCLLANLDRRRPPKSADSSLKQTNGRRKKVKAKATASPMESGRASISRAGSETTKHPDEDDGAADSRSTSGSARGQPHSRDLSPIVSQLGIAGTELSSRERRKIADAEKQFQQLENDQRTTAQKRKKRTSGPSAPSSTTVASSTQTGYSESQRRQPKSLRIDTAASQPRSPTTALSPGSLSTARHGSPRKTSGSNTPFSRSPLSRLTYVDAAVQASVDELDEPPVFDASVRCRSGFVPMTVRLLKRFSMDCLRSEDVARQQLSSAGSDSVAPSSPSVRSLASGLEKSDTAVVDVGSSSRPFSANVGSGDVEMRDVTSNAESDAGLGHEDSNKLTIPPPWPSTAAHNTRIPSSLTDRANLRVSMPPPPSNPAIAPTGSPGSASNASLVSPSIPGASSPVAGVSTFNTNIPTPTPIKKKLSLGDYLSRRGTLATTPTSEKPPAQASTATYTQKSLSTAGPAPAVTLAGGQILKDPPNGKTESLGTRDVSMKDAPESSQPHIPSISS